jgi:HTH-type transcriptional regulator, sugar sensing transcriptional regulator
MIEKLKKIGFSNKEAQIYYKLAKYKQIDVNSLSKVLKVNRTVVYNVLVNLTREGFVSYIKKNKKRYYKINPVENLNSKIEEKKIVTNEIIEELNNVRKIFNIEDTENEVAYFEDKEGLKEIVREMLNLKCKTIRLQNTTGLLFEKLKNNFGLLKGVIKNNNFKIIANQNFKLDESLSRKNNFEVRYLKSKKINYATTYIFKNIVIILLIKDEKPFIIKIKSKKIYEGYKENFDLIWNLLSKKDNK